MNAVTTDQPVRSVRWVPGFVLLAAIWGASFLFIGVGVRELHPTYVALGRVVAGGLTLLVVLLATRDRLPRDPRLWGHLFVASALGVVLPFTLFGYGEERVSTLLAGIYNGATPLIALPVAVLVFRTERFTRSRVVGLLMGFVGVLTVLGIWRGVGGTELTGQLLCLGAAICYGFGIPYMRRFAVGGGQSGVAISAAQLICATVQLAIVAPLIAGRPAALTSLSPEVIGSVLALGILGTGLAFVMNIRNIKLIGATGAAAVAYLIPVFAVIVGVVVLHERLAWYQPVGAVIVLVGVAVSQGALRRRGAASRVPARPAEQVVNRPRVDHGRWVDSAQRRPVAAVVEPVQLAGRVRVGVDAEAAPCLDRQP